MANSTEDIPESEKNALDEPMQHWNVFIAFLRDEPHRTGESFHLPFHTRVILGRGAARMADERRVMPGRKLPGEMGRDREREIETATVSSYELAFEALGTRCVVVTPLSEKHSVRANGRPIKNATEVGDNAVIAVNERLVLLIVKRSRDIPAFRHFDPKLMPAFGRENRLGLVGQSEAFCALMEALVVAV